MSKLTFYLLLLVISAAIFDLERLSNIFPDLTNIKEKNIFKGIVFIGIVGLGIYFSIDVLNQRKSHTKLKSYAEKITTQEFENQKSLYTQLKLSELYRSIEYQELPIKKMNQPYMPYEEISFSDEDN